MIFKEYSGLLNFLLYDKILDWSKWKVFAWDVLNLGYIMDYSFDRVENIVLKGENAGNQHFLLLTLSQTTNFRLFQTERVCRRQFQIR